MRASQRKFFRKGVEIQKKADITIDIRRPDKEVMKRWTEEQKVEAREFAVESLNGFKNFVAEIIAL